MVAHPSGTDCEGLTDPQNGAVSVSGTTEGSTATYTCNIGFNLVGDESRTCQANGDWSGSAPTCQSRSAAVCDCTLTTSFPCSCGVCSVEQPTQRRRHSDWHHLWLHCLVHLCSWLHADWRLQLQGVQTKWTVVLLRPHMHP